MTYIEQRKKALVIAISEYESDELSNLDFCKNDGDEIGKLLKDLGYDVKKQLVGNVDGTTLQDEIIEFFGDPEIKHDDTVLFYYSGHGVPGSTGEVYLSSSNIDPTKPMKRGFSFDELTTMMESCNSRCLVTMLDCCYSGSAKISKSDEKARVKLVQNYQVEKINNLKQGEGKCILSASRGFQESFATMEGKHSFFTHYLLNGLRGANGKSVDKDGIVTPESLMQYIDSEIDKLPINMRPSQTPIRKIETVGRIVLAEYPKYTKSSDDPIILHLKTGPKSTRYPLAVCLIKSHDSSKLATGFLIGPNLIMTDHNVLPTKENAASTTILFDKTIGELGQKSKSTTHNEYDLDPSNIFITSETGYSIVSTKEDIGEKYGWIKLCEEARKWSDQLFLVYYPSSESFDNIGSSIALPSKITDISDITRVSVNNGIMIFRSEFDNKMTPGAPIFSNEWTLVGMYRKIEHPPLRASMTSAPWFQKHFATYESILALLIIDDLKSLCKKGNSNACKILEICKI